MSKNSTARFSSDGDADSNITEVLPNAGSRSSSYKNKKDIEGGPFGDSPSDRTEQAYKNCLLYMIQQNEDSNNPSDCSEQNQELYSLRNDYLEKLNIVRRRLNLIEVNADRENYSNRCQGGCTITELPEEEPPIVKDSPNVSRSSQKEEVSEGSSGELSEGFEIKTIHPFSVCYNMNSQSINNLLEMEYNPPKKKSCFRLRTPKLPSSSESNIPYHTKVSLHEDIFKKPNDPESKEITVHSMSKNYHDKFTVTKSTQCSDHEPEDSATKAESENNVNLFPTVIVRTDSSSLSSVGTSNAASGESKEKQNQAKQLESYPLNFIEEASVESYNTVTTSTTIVESKVAGTRRRRRFGVRNKQPPPEKLDFGRQLKKPQFNQGERAGGDSFRDDIISYNRGPQFKQNIIQFLTYRKEKRRAKSSPIKRKQSVPFGPIIINDYDRGQNLDNKFYFFNSTSLSDDERNVRGFLGGPSGSNSSSEKRETFWASLVSCFRPILDFIRRR